MRILKTKIDDPFVRRGEIFHATLTLSVKEGRAQALKTFDVLLVGFDLADIKERAESPEYIKASLWPYRKNFDTSKVVSVQKIEITKSAGFTVHPLDPVIETTGEISFH
jgi:superfamily I DNA and/or RNA helicase